MPTQAAAASGQPLPPPPDAAEGESTQDEPLYEDSSAVPSHRDLASVDSADDSSSDGVIFFEDSSTASLGLAHKVGDGSVTIDGYPHDSIGTRGGQ